MIRRCLNESLLHAASLPMISANWESTWEQTWKILSSAQKKKKKVSGWEERKGEESLWTTVGTGNEARCEKPAGLSETTPLFFKRLLNQLCESKRNNYRSMQLTRGRRKFFITQTYSRWKYWFSGNNKRLSFSTEEPSVFSLISGHDEMLVWSRHLSELNPDAMALLRSSDRT